MIGIFVKIELLFVILFYFIFILAGYFINSISVCPNESSIEFIERKSVIGLPHAVLTQQCIYGYRKTRKFALC